MAEFRQRILDVESMEALRAVYLEIDSYRMLGAPTVDLQDAPTTLRELVVTIKEAMEAVAAKQAGQRASTETSENSSEERG
ncbi:hypothetical protein ACFYT3_05380 [Nocardia amikacinitolerans]|uniref:hypothetical protein n=1 Tax=Nocardia amikacinitolerans TaxID=756689 RepID=UPI00367B9A7C